MNRRVKRRLWLLSIVAVACAATLLTWVVFASWNRERRIQTSITDGMAAYDRGDYVNALNILRYAVTHKRDDHKLLLAFADSRLRNVDPRGKRGHIDSAIKHYQNVLKLDPGNQEATLALFRIFSKSGRINEALLAAEKIADLDEEILLQKSLLEERSGDVSAALSTLAGLRGVDPEGSGWVIAEYGLRQRMGEDSGVMLREFEGYAEATQNQSIDLIRLILLRGLGRDEEARKLALGLLEHEQIESELLIDLRFQLKRLELEDAYAEIEERIAEAARQDPELAFNLIQLDWRRGATVEAKERSIESARDFEGDLRFLRTAVILDRLSSPTGRSEELEEQLLSQSRSVDTAGAILDGAIIDLVGSLDENSGSTPIESLVQLSRVRALDDTGSYSQFLMIFEGLMLDKIGRVKSAIESYKMAFSNTSARLPGKLLIEAYIRDQELDQALATAKRMNILFPSVDSSELESRTLLMLARTGRNVLASDVILNQAGSLSEAVKNRYIYWAAQQMNASPLLPIIAESALMEGDEQNLLFAQTQAMEVETIAPSQLLLIAQLSKDRPDGFYDRLLQRAGEVGGTEFDIGITRVIDEADVVLRVRGLLDLEELASEMPAGSKARTAAYRRLLVQHAINEVEWKTKIGAIKALHQELADDVQTARFILNIPEIWIKDPGLAAASLELIKSSMGEESPVYVLAEARRVLQAPEIDQRERAMMMVAVDRVIKESSESVEACLIMSSLLQSGTNPDLGQAVVYLRRVLDLRPDLVSLYPPAISLLQATGDGALALEYLSQYRELLIDDEELARLRATILARQGDTSSAVSEFSRLIDENENLIDRIYLGGLLTRLEMNEAAIEQYDRVLEEEPANVLAILRKATTLAAMGEETAGIEVISGNEDLGPGERIRYEILIHRAAGNSSEARAKVDELVIIEPEDIKSWLTMYEVYKETDDIEKRIGALERVLELDPGNIDGLTYLVLEYMGRGGMDDRARAYIAELKQVLPGRGRLLELRQSAMNTANGALEPDVAQLKASRELLRERPTSADANKLAWEMHKAFGDHVAALSVAKNAVSSLPSSTQPHQWAIESALAAGYWDEAIELAETARSRLSPSERAMHDLKTAELCLALGYDTRAIRNIERFVPVIGSRALILGEAGSSARVPENYPEMMRMTVLKSLLAADRSDEAYELYEPLISQDPEMLDVWVLASTSAEPYESRRAMSKVVPKLQETSGGRLMLVKALLLIADKSGETEDIERALETLREVREIDAGLGIVELDLHESTLLTLLEREDEATEMLEGIVERLGRNGTLDTTEPASVSDVAIYVSALNNLAYLYANQSPPDNDRAGEVINQALSITAPRYRASLLDTKALIDLQTGDCEQSESAIRTAIEIQPGTLEFRFRLLDVLISCDQLLEARSTAIAVQESLLAAPKTDVAALNRVSELIEQIQTRANGG